MSKPLEQRQVGELAFVTLLLALAAGVAVEAWRIAGFSGISSPGAFPLGVSTVLLLSGSVILGDALRKPSAAAGGWLSAARQFCAQHFPRCILVFIALAVAYLASIQWASFYPPPSSSCCSRCSTCAAVGRWWRCWPAACRPA